MRKSPSLDSGVPDRVERVGRDGDGPGERPRRGRRAGGGDTRRRVLDAARARFAARGYDATTMRGIARDAGVDPALLHYFFGSKDQLFAAALEFPRSPAQVVDELTRPGADTADLGERLLRLFLTVWDDETSGTPFLTLVRTAPGHEQAATLLREFISREVVGRLARALDADQPELRASLLGTQIVGLAMLRYVVRLEPLASADHETLVAAVGPTLNRYLTGPLGPVRVQASAGTFAGSDGPS
jgi:AcrR family transcriptional regulator